MPHSPHLICSVLMLWLGLTASCGFLPDKTGSVAENPSAGASDSKAREGLDELQELINLSAEPDEVSWTEEELDAEAAEKIGRKLGTKRLVAVLRFESENERGFLELFQQSGQPVAAAIEVEEWFPAELAVQAQAEGDEAVKGQSVPATKLFKGAYSDGRLIKLDGSPVYIIELFTQ